MEEAFVMLELVVNRCLVLLFFFFWDEMSKVLE